MSDFILSEQLIRNIWLRLPIKSTIRFRCVSKSWCASLSNPQFIYRNLTSFDDVENGKDLLLVSDRNKQFYSVVSHETPLLVPTPLQVSPLREVPPPTLDECFTEVPTYACDDLVCFHNESGEVIGVWNLTTGETKILPQVSSSFEFVALGFGFDAKIQDYKIVQIGHYCGYEVAAFVYSLRSGNNCWRKLDEPYLPNLHYVDPYSRSYRDGKFYWREGTDVIASFDMSSEVFNTISIRPLPHPIEEIESFRILKNGSSMLITSRTYSNVEYVLWALLEIGVSSSLTKLFRIDWQRGEARSLGFWRNELVFHWCRNNRLLIGDPSSEQEPTEVQIDERLSILTCLAWTKGKNSLPLN